MKGLKYFCFYAALLLVIQVAVLFTLGRWDAFLDKYLFLYYPTIWMVERCGHFSGESNLIEPILIGVPLGVFFYSIILASILTFARTLKRSLNRA
jgi:hypothetical protein